MDLLYKYQRIQELPNTKEKLHKIININHEFLEHDELDLYIQSGIDIITLSLEFVELETAERYIRRLSDLVGIVEHNEYETILDLKIQYHIACCEYDEALYSLELKKPYLTTVSSFDSFYMTLGNVLFLKEDFIGAINTFNKINNEDLNYQKNVSLILLHLEVYNVDIAQDIYQKVKSQQPSNDMYYLIDSKIAKINNELLESLELMEKYYNKTNDPSCIIEYIELLIENKKIDQAKELYNTSKNMINTNKNTDVIKFDKLYHLLYTKKLPKQKQRMNMSDYIELLELERNNSLHELLSNVFQRIFSKLQCTRLSYLDLYIDQSEIYYFKSKLLLSKSIDLSTLSNTFFEFCLLNEEEIIIEDDLTKYIDFFTNKYYSKSTSILTMKLAFDDHVSALLIAEYDHENYHQDEFYFIGKMINELVFSYYNHEKSKHTKQLNKLMVQKNGLGSIKLNKNHINVSEEAKTILGTEENMLSYDEFDTIIQDDDYHDLKNSIYLPNDIHHVQLVNGNIIDILFYSEYPNYRFLIERKAYYTKLLNLTDLSYKNTHNHFKNETRFLLDYPNIDKNKTSLIMLRF